MLVFIFSRFNLLSSFARLKKSHGGGGGTPIHLTLSGWRKQRYFITLEKSFKKKKKEALMGLTAFPGQLI